MLSQDMTVKGAMPAARRRFRPARIRPKTVFGLVGIGGVGDDVRMRRIELAGGRVDEIAALGDGQRDDADRRIGEPCDDRRRCRRASRKSIIAPVTRACMWPASCSTTVVSQSCALSIVAARLLALEDAGADERPVVVEARR